MCVCGGGGGKKKKEIKRGDKKIGKEQAERRRTQTNRHATSRPPSRAQQERPEVNVVGFPPYIAHSALVVSMGTMRTAVARPLPAANDVPLGHGGCLLTMEKSGGCGQSDGYRVVAGHRSQYDCPHAPCCQPACSLL